MLIDGSSLCEGRGRRERREKRRMEEVNGEGLCMGSGQRAFSDHERTRRRSGTERGGCPGQGASDPPLHSAPGHGLCTVIFPTDPPAESYGARQNGISGLIHYYSEIYLIAFSYIR